jgi:site-specific recombinase XerD
MDLRLNVVKVKNKGSVRPKPLPYTDTIKQTVQRYLIWRAREAEDGEDALLVEATHGGRLSISRTREIVVGLGGRAGVTINPHRLRDSFGTTMVNSGAEIEHVQVMMGHSTREMTMAYVNLADQRVTDTHQKIMGPMLDNLMTEAPGLPDDIDEPPAGWPIREAP